MTPKCCICNKPMGEITKAKMLKTTKFLCEDDYKTMKVWREMAAKEKEPDYMGMFNDMLKGKK